MTYIASKEIHFSLFEIDQVPVLPLTLKLKRKADKQKDKPTSLHNDTQTQW